MSIEIKIKRRVLFLIDARIGIKIAEKFLKKHFDFLELVSACVFKDSYIIIFDAGILRADFKLVVVDIETLKIMELRS